MKKSIFVAIFIMLMVSVSVLYAQADANLKQGVYRFTGARGEQMLVIQNTRVANVKTVTLRNADGSMLMQGEGRIRGNRMVIDYGVNSSETWTIIDEETFVDNQIGVEWYWIRDLRTADYPRNW